MPADTPASVSPATDEEMAAISDFRSSGMHRLGFGCGIMLGEAQLARILARDRFLMEALRKVEEDKKVLREAMAPFAAEGQRFEGSTELYRYKPDRESRLGVGHFRAARAALSFTETSDA